MVLQRNQISVSGFLNNSTIFGLTIVCAVLGMVTSYTSDSHVGSTSALKDTVVTMNTGNQMKSHYSAM